MSEGRLHPRGRGVLAKPDAKIQIKEKADPTGTLGKPGEILAGLKTSDWNEYRIAAKGGVLQLFVNGKQTVEVDDHSKAAAKSGVLALQLHAGPPMMVQFREVVLKVLKWGARGACPGLLKTRHKAYTYHLQKC